MEQEYYVLYKRDWEGEKMQKAQGRMLYDRIKGFDAKDAARNFGLQNLQDPAIVFKSVRDESDFRPDAEYIVAAFFQRKYQHHCFDGSSNDVPTHEVMRFGYDNLSSCIEILAKEKPNKIYLGIEEVLIPSALDQIRSINGD